MLTSHMQKGIAHSGTSGSLLQAQSWEQKQEEKNAGLKLKPVSLGFRVT